MPKCFTILNSIHYIPELILDVLNMILMGLVLHVSREELEMIVKSLAHQK